MISTAVRKVTLNGMKNGEVISVAIILPPLGSCASIGCEMM